MGRRTVASMHVNTVYNRQQHVRVADARRARYKTIQNSATRSEKNTFVADKKKCVSLDGTTMTRIEFNQSAVTSSNYTVNNAAVNHAVYAPYFDLLCRAQGEKLERQSRFIITNVNYTSSLYGVTNAFTLDAKLNSVEKNYNRPFSFPAYFNWSGSAVRNAVFPSLYINSQKVLPTQADQIGTAVANLEPLLEMDAALNAYCNRTFLRDRCFINTPNKILLLLLHEMYLAFGVRAPHADFMDSLYAAYANTMLGHCAQQTNQYQNKNVTFAHLVPMMLLHLSKGRPLDLDFLLKSYVARATAAGGETLYELVVVLKCCSALPGVSFSDGALVVNGSTFASGVDDGRCRPVSRRVDSILQKSIHDHCKLVFRDFAPQDCEQTKTAE